MRERFARFMQGRYGADGFGRFLILLAFLMVILSFFRIPYVSLVGLFILVIVYIRMFSKNTRARYQENLLYYRVKNKLTAPFRKMKRRFSDRKTHRYYRCPKCKKELRVPKGKGLILVKCPCGNSFKKRT